MFQCYSVKDPVRRMKRYDTDCEKIFANHISSKGLVSRIYKELGKFNSKNTKQSSEKMSKRDISPKRSYRWQISTWKICSTSLRACSVAKSCPTLCDPMDCSLPGLSVHGIFQAGIVVWVAIALRRSSWPRDWTCVSCIGRWVLCHWPTREALNIITNQGNANSDHEISRHIYEND